MKTKIFTALVAILILSTNAMAQDNISIKSRTIGMDKNWNKFIAIVEITVDNIGHMSYVEEYYSLDSKGDPKFYSASILYDDNMTNNTMRLRILRPMTRLGVPYSLIKSVVIIDDKRTEKWLNSSGDKSRIKYVGNVSPEIIPIISPDTNESDMTNLSEYNESDESIPSKKNSLGFDGIIFTITTIFTACRYLRLRHKRYDLKIFNEKS